MPRLTARHQCDIPVSMPSACKSYIRGDILYYRYYIVAYKKLFPKELEFNLKVNPKTYHMYSELKSVFFGLTFCLNHHSMLSLPTEFLYPSRVLNITNIRKV